MIPKMFPWSKSHKINPEALQAREAKDIERIERNEEVIAESKRINAMLVEILPRLGDVMADMVGKPINDV